MKFKIFAITMASLFIGGIAPSVYGQQNQPQLVEILEVQVKPEFTAQYEAAVKESMAWRKENGFPFQVSAFQLGGRTASFYRFNTRIGTWSGRDQINQWFAPFMNGDAPAFVDPLFGSIDNASVSYQMTRPNLYYLPDDPRTEFSSLTAVHELRLYPKSGTNRQVREILEKFVEVYADHGIQSPKSVWRQVAGTDGPVITNYFPAASTEAFYANRASDLQEMGSDFQDLVEELAPFLRKSENLDWTIRRDLGLQP